MSRFDTRNFSDSAKMYSVIGTTLAKQDELIQCGMVGEIGDRIEADVYEFLPLSATSTNIFFIATPEVDADESKIANNSLHGFALKLGDVTDAIETHKYAKFAIEEAGIEGLPEGGALATGYLYAKATKRQLQYKATLPESVADGALMIAKIESVIPATQGMVVKPGTASNRGLVEMQLQYKLVTARIIKTL